MTFSGCDRLNSIPTSHTPATTPPALFPRKSTPSFPQRRKSNPIIRHSHACGNPTPSSVIPTHAGIQPHHPSFPRRRESTIPAHAGIHRPITPMPEKNTPSFPRMRESNPIIRHSREGGNQTPSSVIPAKAGIHNSRACGNSSSHYPNARKNTPPPSSVIPAKAGIKPHHPSFPRRRESTIPAHAGIHRPITPMPEKTLRHSRA